MRNKTTEWSSSESHCFGQPRLQEKSALTPFDENQGVRLLLYEVERYEAALLSIARKPADSLCQRRASRRKLLNARLS